MASPDKKKLQEALDLVTLHGSAGKASNAIDGKIAKSTIQDRVKQAKRKGMTPSKRAVIPEEPDDDYMSKHFLETQVKSLRAEIKEYEYQKIDSEFIKKKIYSLKSMNVDPPDWVLKPQEEKGCPGVPVLVLSDLHWEEAVNKDEIGGVNQYNLPIARQRLKQLGQNLIDVCFSHMVKPDYPGLVIMMPGDNFSGNLHDLNETNELPMMAAFNDLQNHLTALFDELLKHFKNIFVVGTAGNHGRNSIKPKTKNRATDNWDWLLYVQMESYYRGKGEKNIQFLSPTSPDVLFKIYNTRFMLTHGDQFRGGDGMIGPLGPIMRGDWKKRGKQMQIDQNYDVMVMGHFHFYMYVYNRLLVNGSLKGYDEYANLLNLPFQPPLQALFLVHPERGITFNIPIPVEEKVKREPGEWVSIFKP